MALVGERRIWARWKSVQLFHIMARVRNLKHCGAHEEDRNFNVVSSLAATCCDRRSSCLHKRESAGAQSGGACDKGFLDASVSVRGRVPT
jgi:hypothetical protein